MTKYELRETLNTNHQVCEDMCLYELLDCETEDEFEDSKALSIECLRIEMSHISRLIDSLNGLTFDEVKNNE